jgi:1-acyl-sn-glycerol-3-phosphate acyltransferase
MQTYHFQYPRRRFLRTIIKAIGKLILPIFFKLEFEGFENFPKKGPVIVVANHYAIMEAVLIVIYAPYQLEFMGSVDVPHEKITDFFFRLYQVIPVFRGKTEQGAFKKAIDILRSGGQIAIFPEGGHFDPGHMEAQSGVAWMSYKASAPVLPIGISGAMGALTQAFQFKRPMLKMKVGTIIPALEIEDRKQKKSKLKQYAQLVMQHVKTLLTLEELNILNEEQNITYQFSLHLFDENKNEIEIPEELAILDQEALVQLLYKKIIWKIYRVNYKLPIDALEMIHTNPSMQSISLALISLLAHLNDENNGNPYLLTYRFGELGYKMKSGLEQLLTLTHWCLENNYTYQINMQREFDSLSLNQHIIQVEQERL